MRLGRLPLFLGGFMGPFGTVVIVPMFPELRTEFDASASAVNLGFSLYLLPFAALLLVSGTLGERWGRRRTVRTTYLVYAAASLACVLAPTLGLFVAARAVQGVANAFITPLLLAGLAETVPADRFGRTAGIYSSFQALGSAAGPIAGGLAADTDWRYAFIGTAVIAAGLALFPPQGEARPGVQAPSLRPLLNTRLVMLGIAFMCAATGPIGLAVLVGIVARDDLMLTGTTAGLILMSGSLSALVFGPFWGAVLDRLGPRRAGMVAVSGATLLAGATVFGDTAWRLGIIWAIAGALIGFVAVVFQAMGATLMPDNRGGALSFLLAFRFVGHAIGPWIFVGGLLGAVDRTLLTASALGIVTLALTVIYAPRARSVVQDD